MVNFLDYPNKIIVVPDDNDINVMSDDSGEETPQEMHISPSTSRQTGTRHAGTQTYMSDSSSESEDDVVFVEHVMLDAPMEANEHHANLPSTSAKDPECPICDKNYDGITIQSNTAPGTSQDSSINEPIRRPRVETFDIPTLPAILERTNAYNVFCFSNGTCYDPTTGNVTLCRNPPNTLQAYLINATAESAIYIVYDSGTIPIDLRSVYCNTCSRVHPKHMPCIYMQYFPNMHVTYTRNNEQILLPYSMEVVQMEGNQGAYRPSIASQDMITIRSTSNFVPLIRMNYNNIHHPIPTMPFQSVHSRMQSDPINLSYRHVNQELQLDMAYNAQRFTESVHYGQSMFGLRNQRIFSTENMPSTSILTSNLFQYNPRTMNNTSMDTIRNHTPYVQNRFNPPLNMSMDRRNMHQYQNRHDHSFPPMPRRFHEHH